MLLVGHQLPPQASVWEHSSSCTLHQTVAMGLRAAVPLDETPQAVPVLSHKERSDDGNRAGLTCEAVHKHTGRLAALPFPSNTSEFCDFARRRVEVPQ